MDLIRDRIKEIIDGCVYKVARVVLVDQEIEVEEDGDVFFVSLIDMGLTDACLCALQDYIELEELTLDELVYATEACEEACVKMEDIMVMLTEE